MFRPINNFLSYLPILNKNLGKIKEINPPTYLSNLAEKCSEKSNVEFEIKVHKTNKIFCGTSYSIIGKPKIEISSEVLKEFNEKELKIIIFHEISHMKSDIKILRLLSFLSDITFFGRGALASIKDFSVKEFEADLFAASQIGSTEEVIETIKHFNRFSGNIYKNSQIGGVNFGFGFEPVILVDNVKKESFSRKIRAVFSMLFGDGFLVYMHPSHDQRIDYLNKKRI